jgi:nicotinate-nucleotide pyrophosphorylase (carboxylating)
MTSPAPSSEPFDLIAAALAEDIGTGDVTAHYCIPPTARGTAVFRSRSRCVLSGITQARAVCAAVDADLVFTPAAQDGDLLEPGTTLASVEGPLRSLVAAERTALNFLQHLSGIATFTRTFVDAVQGTDARILDTRKTLPGWRLLAKAAVRHGGGTNHRMGLYDRVLVKDNHIAGVPRDTAGWCALTARIRAERPGMEIEFEADTLEQIALFLPAAPDYILLDNMPPATLREAVRMIGGLAKTEASGGVTLQTVRSLAETGVNFISIGALTHSAPAADIGLDLL